MKMIKTALLAYGMSGRVFHAPFLKPEYGYSLIGAWERSKRQIVTDYPDAKSFTSLDEVLQSDVDLVIVNTPVETHFEYAKLALLAGKHVLVEKAFTTNEAQANELIQVAQLKNVKLCVFQNRRWDSDFKTVKDILQRNLVGEIVDVEIHFTRSRPNLSPKLHKESQNPGAGILHDLGSHSIDQAIHLFGFPKALFASIRVTRNDSLVNDWFDITLFYDQMNVRLKASYFVRETLPSFIINGKLGSFVKNRGDVQENDLSMGKIPNDVSWGIENAQDHGILHTENNGEIVRKKVTSMAGNYSEFFDKLYRSIIQNQPLPVSESNMSAVMRIIDAAQESNKLGMKINF